MKNFTKIVLLALFVACYGKSEAQTELTFYTNMGRFKVMLTDTLTPITVDSFVSRVKAKFYDGLIFHRVVAGFVIQGGDPLGTGYGGPGYYTPDEIVPSLKNVVKSVAMANSGPNTNGSQFYINVVNNLSLDGSYTVFGMTTSGFDTVLNISHVPVNSADRPLTDVVMDSVRITSAPTAVNNVVKGAAVSVYPNPCQGLFNLLLPPMETTVRIINIQGQQVYSASAKDALKVDLRNEPAGLYILSATNANGTYQCTLVLQ